MMKYAVSTERQSNFLSGFYFNGNGSVREIFVFRKNSWFAWDTFEDAENFIQRARETIKSQTHYEEGLQAKLLKYCDKLRVYER